jgi:hypothetical protein
MTLSAEKRFAVDHRRRGTDFDFATFQDEKSDLQFRARMKGQGGGGSDVARNSGNCFYRRPRQGTLVTAVRR